MTAAYKYSVKPQNKTISSGFNAANYARANPQDAAVATTFFEGYLRTTFGAALDSARFGLPKRDGKFVVEVIRNAPSSGNGVGAGLSVGSFSTATWLGADSNGFALYSGDFGIFESGAQDSATPTWNDSNVSFVMAVDLTGNNPVIHFVVNEETFIDTTYTWTNADLSSEDVFLTTSGSTNDSITINTGRLKWRNRHIRRLFPDYELGWPSRVDEDVVFINVPSVAPITPEIVIPLAQRSYRHSGRYV